MLWQLKKQRENFFVNTKSNLALILIFVSSCLKAVNCIGYNITTDDDRIIYSPRLFGRSAVVYNNQMYVYGGRKYSVISHTSDMYKYDFDTTTGKVTLTMVNQTNSGPSCAFCGPVMIDDSHMMILSHKFADALLNSTESRTVIKPYIFDFSSLTWSEKEQPTYNKTEEDVYTMRARHSTVLGSDGMVYVIGGTNHFESNTPLNTSWYYDLVSNSYGTINNNGFNYLAIGPSVFNLPDKNIGSVFGKSVNVKGQEVYNTHSTMMVLDTRNKKWINNQTLIMDSESREWSNTIEGASVQLIPNTTYAYFFGAEESYWFKEYQSFISIERLDLSTNSWKILRTVNNLDKAKSVRLGKGYASTAIILDKYVVFAFGVSSCYLSGETSDFDIFELPVQESSNNTMKVKSSINWVSSLSDKTSDSSPPLSTIWFGLSIGVLLGAIFIAMCVLMNRNSIKFNKRHNRRKFIDYFRMRRVGETFSTHLYGVIADLLFLLIFLSFIVHFAFNIKDSPVSTTTEALDKPGVPFPDIRFCYSGWDYDNPSDEIGSEFPELVCSLTEIKNYGVSCGNVSTLPRSILVPYFASIEKNVKCYMYSMFNGDSYYIGYNNITYLEFLNRGSITEGTHQVLNIQLYEPTKNPNRAVFDQSPFFKWDNDYLDNWMDFDITGDFFGSTLGQETSINSLAGADIQFKIVYTKQIDPNSLWNFVGVYPKYIDKSELSITHIELTNSKSEGFNNYSGTIRVYPIDNKMTTITERRDVTIVSTLGVLGGIISMLIAVRVLLFGTRPTEPRGAFQRISIRSSWEESKRRNLMKYFRIPDFHSVPFVTPVHQRFSKVHILNSDYSNASDDSCLKSADKLMGPQSSREHNVMNTNSVSASNDVMSRLTQLEGRNQMLELVLKAYYIDDRIFRELHALSLEDNYENKDSVINETVGLDHEDK